MDEKLFAAVTYVRGDSNLGSDRIKIYLVSHSTSLIFQSRSDNIDLLSIPWGNIRQMKIASTEKSASGRFLAATLGAFPPFNVTNITFSGEWGFYLTYENEETQLKQSPFLAVGGKVEKSHRLIDQIWAYRDDFYRTVGRHSSPQRR